MYAKVAFLLLGLAVTAFGETCTCSGLKSCVDRKKDASQKSHDKCVARCGKKLPGDTDKIQQCIKDKSDSLEKLKDNQVDCLLNPTAGACVAPRARRQAPTEKNNFFVQPGPSDFQPASNRGKWIHADAQAQAQAQAQADTSSTIGVDADELLKPYHDCMHSCLQEMHPEKGEGLFSGATQQAVDPIGRNLAAIQECQLTEKCAINLPSLANAAQTLCQSDRADVLSFKQDIKLSFCRCVRGVLEKDESEMPCVPDANGGRSKGGQSD